MPFVGGDQLLLKVTLRSMEMEPHQHYPGEPTPHLFKAGSSCQGKETQQEETEGHRTCGKGHCGSTERHPWVECAGGNGF